MPYIKPMLEALAADVQALPLNVSSYHQDPTADDRPGTDEAEGKV
jgi:hypothetical protein